MTPQIGRFFRLIRGDEWWYSKIPPLLGIFFVQVHVEGVQFLDAMTLLVPLFGSICCVAAHGHLVNDYFDRTIDREADKPNLLCDLSEAECRLLIVGVTACALASFYAVADKYTVAVFLVMYVAATLYSMPPARCKERGICGVFVAALAQRALPATFVVATVSSVAGKSLGARPILATVVGVWSFLVGVRWIIVHQLLDAGHDIRSGVRSSVVVHGTASIQFALKFLIAPSEGLALCLWLAFVCRQFPWLTAVLGLYAGFLLLHVRRLGSLWAEHMLVSFRLAPLADFYEVWLPLAVAVGLAIWRPAFIVFAILFVVLFFKHVKWRAYEVVDVFS